MNEKILEQINVAGKWAQKWELADTEATRKLAWDSYLREMEVLKRLKAKEAGDCA
jgi:hypothetical protein